MTSGVDNRINSGSATLEHEYPATFQFRYSHAALATGILAVVLAATPAGRADVAIAGFVVMWASLYLFLRRSVRTIRYWVPMMTSMVLWFVVVSVSGSMSLWAGRADARPGTETTSQPVHVDGVDLHGSATLTGPQILVSDNGDKPWSDVTLSFTGADGKRYTSHVDGVASGQTLRIQLSRFVAEDGHPAPVAVVKPRSVRVSAKVDGRDGAFESRLAS